MKKLIAAMGVLGVFVLYGLGVRHELPAVGKTGTPVKASAADTSTGDSSAGGPAAPPTSSDTNASVRYKDGTYTGSVADAYYGNVQVAATIAGGKITGVTFLQYPSDHSDSVMINQQAMPDLQQEAVQSQVASVPIISGATFTSEAFVQSLAAALNRAKA